MDSVTIGNRDRKVDSYNDLVGGKVGLMTQLDYTS